MTRSNSRRSSSVYAILASLFSISCLLANAAHPDIKSDAGNAVGAADTDLTGATIFNGATYTMSLGRTNGEQAPTSFLFSNGAIGKTSLVSSTANRLSIVGCPASDCGSYYPITILIRNVNILGSSSIRFLNGFPASSTITVEGLNCSSLVGASADPFILFFFLSLRATSLAIRNSVFTQQATMIVLSQTTLVDQQSAFAVTNNRFEVGAEVSSGNTVVAVDCGGDTLVLRNGSSFAVDGNLLFLRHFSVGLRMVKTAIFISHASSLIYRGNSQLFTKDSLGVQIKGLLALSVTPFTVTVNSVFEVSNNTVTHQLSTSTTQAALFVMLRMENPTPVALANRHFENAEDSPANDDTGLHVELAFESAINVNMNSLQRLQMRVGEGLVFLRLIELTPSALTIRNRSRISVSGNLLAFPVGTISAKLNFSSAGKLVITQNTIDSRQIPNSTSARTPIWLASGPAFGAVTLIDGLRGSSMCEEFLVNVSNNVVHDSISGLFRSYFSLFLIGRTASNANTTSNYLIAESSITINGNTLQRWNQSRTEWSLTTFDGVDDAMGFLSVDIEGVSIANFTLDILGNSHTCQISHDEESARRFTEGMYPMRGILVAYAPTLSNSTITIKSNTLHGLFVDAAVAVTAKVETNAYSYRYMGSQGNTVAIDGNQIIAVMLQSAATAIFNPGRSARGLATGVIVYGSEGVVLDFEESAALYLVTSRGEVSITGNRIYSRLLQFYDQEAPSDATAIPQAIRVNVFEVNATNYAIVSNEIALAPNYKIFESNEVPELLVIGILVVGKLLAEVSLTVSSNTVQLGQPAGLVMHPGSSFVRIDAPDSDEGVVYTNLKFDFSRNSFDGGYNLVPTAVSVFTSYFINPTFSLFPALMMRSSRSATVAQSQAICNQLRQAYIKNYTDSKVVDTNGFTFLVAPVCNLTIITTTRGTTTTTPTTTSIAARTTTTTTSTTSTAATTSTTTPTATYADSSTFSSSAANSTEPTGFTISVDTTTSTIETVHSEPTTALVASATSTSATSTSTTHNTSDLTTNSTEPTGFTNNVDTTSTSTPTTAHTEPTTAAIASSTTATFESSSAELSGTTTVVGATQTTTARLPNPNTTIRTSGSTTTSTKQANITTTLKAPISSNYSSSTTSTTGTAIIPTTAFVACADHNWRPYNNPPPFAATVFSDKIPNGLTMNVSLALSMPQRNSSNFTKGYGRHLVFQSVGGNAKGFGFHMPTVLFEPRGAYAILHVSPLPGYAIEEAEGLEVLVPESAFGTVTSCVASSEGNMLAVGVLTVELRHQPLVDAQVATTTISVVSTVVTSVFGAAGMAADQQGLAAMAMMTCADPHTRAAFGSYRSLSPFALWDSYIGVVAGNFVFLAAVFALQLCLLTGLRLVKRVRSWEVLSAMSRFPSVLLNCSFAVHTGTAFAASQLISLPDRPAEDRAVGALAFAFTLLYPLGLAGFAHKFVSRAYQSYATSDWLSERGSRLPPFLAHLLLPKGAIYSVETRRTFGSYIGAYRLPNIYWPSYPTWTPLIFAVAGLFHPDTIPECQALYSCMGIALLGCAGFVLHRRPLRSDAANWLDCTARALSAIVLLCMSAAIVPGLTGSNAAKTAFAFGFIQTSLTMLRAIYTFAMSRLDSSLSTLPLTHEWVHYTSDGAKTAVKFGGAEDFMDDLIVESQKRDEASIESSEELKTAPILLPELSSSDEKTEGEYLDGFEGVEVVEETSEAAQL